MGGSYEVSEWQMGGSYVLIIKEVAEICKRQTTEKLLL
jgi:hypothetical protein